MSSSQFRGGDIFCVKTETETEGNGGRKRLLSELLYPPLKKGLIFFKKKSYLF